MNFKTVLYIGINIENKNQKKKKTACSKYVHKAAEDHLPAFYSRINSIHFSVALFARRKQKKNVQTINAWNGQKKKSLRIFILAEYRFKRKWHGGKCRVSSNRSYTQSLMFKRTPAYKIQDDRTSISTGLNPLNQLLAENLKYVFVHSPFVVRISVYVLFLLRFSCDLGECA